MCPREGKRGQEWASRGGKVGWMDRKRCKCFWTRLRCDDLRLYYSGPRHMSICFVLFFFFFDIKRISAVQFSFFKHLAFLDKRALVFVKQPRGCSATRVAMARSTQNSKQRRCNKAAVYVVYVRVYVYLRRGLNSYICFILSYPDVLYATSS